MKIIHPYDVSSAEFNEILSGLKVAVEIEPNIEIRIGDEIDFREVINERDLVYGRTQRAVIVQILNSEVIREGNCFVAFVPVLPDDIPKIPVRQFLNMYYMYVDKCREYDKLREEIR